MLRCKEMINQEPDRKRSYHHGDLRQALLEATIEIAKERGLAAITMRSVSTRAGVSEAAPYHHFSNKADLLAAAATLAFRHFGDAISAGVEAARSDGREPIIGAVEGYVRFALTDVGEYQLLFGRHITELSLDERAEVRSAARPSIDVALHALTEALAERNRPIAAEEAFPLLRAVLHGTVGLVHEKELGPDTSVEEAIALATRAVTALLDGLGKPTQDREGMWRP
jgi:AcrR family transcriptional regulator